MPSLALGSGEVTLESLTTAYAVFASGGVRRPPVYIKRVEDANGKVLYAAPCRTQQVITPQTAFLMTHMLADVINHGTAWTARQLGFKLPAAGKTGTTNDYHDAWFVGYTPRLVTGVWIGFDQPQTIIGGGYAAEVAVPLWAGFMRKATTAIRPSGTRRRAASSAANVCRLSGKRPADGCSGAVLEADDGASTTARPSTPSTSSRARARGDLPTSQRSRHRQPHGVLDWRERPVRRHAGAVRKRPAHRTRPRRPRSGPAPRLCR